MLFLKTILRWKQRLLILSAATFVAGLTYKLLQTEHELGTIDIWEVWGGAGLAFIVTKIFLNALVRAFWRKAQSVTDGLSGKSQS